jgi:hypothetical protein
MCPAALQIENRCSYMSVNKSANQELVYAVHGKRDEDCELIGDQ